MIILDYSGGPEAGFGVFIRGGRVVVAADWKGER